MRSRSALKWVLAGLVLFFGLLLFSNASLFAYANRSDKEIHILYSSSSHGYFEPCG